MHDADFSAGEVTTEGQAAACPEWTGIHGASPPDPLVPPATGAMAAAIHLLRLLGTLARRHALHVTAGVALCVLLAGPAVPSQRTPAGVASRGVAVRSFTDAEIAEGFFKIVFGAELHGGPRVDRVRKYAAPVRVFIVDGGRTDHRRRLEHVIGDIHERIAGLDIAVVAERDAANMVIRLVRDRELPGTIRNVYGRERARRIESLLRPQCLSGLRKDDRFRIVHSDVILVIDAGEFIFTDCAYEEVLQALGPINDDETIPWTMFNDEVQLGRFGLYDQYLLNILYHPRIRPGMTRDEAAAVLADILPGVREFVDRKNARP